MVHPESGIGRLIKMFSSSGPFESFVAHDVKKTSNNTPIAFFIKGSIFTLNLRPR